MSGDVVAKLRVTYLVGGMPNLDGSLAEGSLRLLPDLMFARQSHQACSIVGTDERGILCTYNAKFEKQKAVQLPPNESLVLDPIPPALIRQSVLAFGNQWQSELLEQMSSRAGRLRTLPVVFTAKNLRAPSPDDKDMAGIHKDLASLGPLAGQMLAQPRVLIVLFDKDVLEHPPDAVEAKIDKQTFLLSRLGKPVAMEISRGRKASFYGYCSGQPGLPEGRYVVKVPKDTLRARFRAGPTSRTFEVAFGVRTLAGDFDFHVFEFPSAESAVLTHFADQFSHILEPPVDARDPGGGASPVFAAADSQTLRARVPRLVAEWKPKLTVGYSQVNMLGGLPDLFRESLKSLATDESMESWGRQHLRAAAKTAGAVAGSKAGVLRTTAKQMLGEDAEKGWKGVVGMALEAWEVHDQVKELRESWKKLTFVRENAHALRRVREAVDAKGIKKLYLQSKWRDHAIEQLAKHEEGERNLLGYYLHWQQEGADADLIRRAMSKSLPAELKELQTAIGAALKVGGEVWGLSASVRHVAQTAVAWTAAGRDEKIDRSKLLTYLDDYQKWYRGKPCLQAVPRLEAARRQSDVSAAGAEEAKKEAFEAAINVARDVLRFLPVTQEAMMMVDLAEAAYELGRAGVDGLGEMVDRYLWRYRSARARIVELYKNHAEQVRALREKAKEAGKGKADGKGEHDPEVQFRVRVMVVIGLLALVERCGRRRDGAKFEAKVKQYRVEEYIQRYLSRHGEVALPLSVGNPMDELWLYSFGHRSNSLEDLALTTGATEWPGLEDLETTYVSTDYHDNFPCYGMDSDSGVEFVKAFSRNFADVADKDLAFSAVYVRKNRSDPWIPPSQATWKIGPFTPVRVVAVFKSSEDLNGTPVSLQLKRSDRSYDGPVYRSMIVRAFATAESGDDKGLMPSVAAEKKYVGDKDAYSCVFFPFYYYKTNYIDGLKPFGTIETSNDMKMSMRFSLKVGDDAKLLTVEPKSGEVTLHFPESSKVHVEMITDNDFMAHKASNAYTKRLFVDNRVWVAGVFVPSHEGGCTWIGAETLGDPVSLRANRRFVFKWGAPCDLVIVLFGEGAGVMNYAEDPIEFPAKARMRIPHWHHFDDAGPEYELIFKSLEKGRRVTSTTTDELQQLLRAAKIDLPACVNHVPIRFESKDLGSLFAARLSPSFSITGSQGSLISKKGFKPFGPEYHEENQYQSGEAGGPRPYEYTISVTGDEGLGLQLHNALELSLPGVPSTLFADSALNAPDAVTDKKYWKSTVLEKMRF